MRLQCAKCPWKKNANPREIPRGYCETKHRKLARTIAKSPFDVLAGGPLRIMACHDTHDLPCVGWLRNQLGPGNNVALRVAVSCGSIDPDVETVGPQHGCFEDTLPRPETPESAG